MYKAFFGLAEKPFSKTPDPRYLFLSRGHREALARLQLAVEERELVLLTGEIGSGKTTLSRALMDALGEDCRVILMVNPRLTPLEFLRSLAHRLDIAEPERHKADLLEQIGKALFTSYERNLLPVVVIDEAQLVPHKETFDEIRLLTNFQLDDRNLLSLVLMGQPELRRRLQHRVYEPLRQRIGLHYDLGPLDPAETGAYLDFRVSRAGGREGLFSAEAVAAIHGMSAGIPRRINQVASLALLEGFGRGTPVIDAAVIEAVRTEFEGFLDA